LAVSVLHNCKTLAEVMRGSILLHTVQDLSLDLRHLGKGVPDCQRATASLCACCCVSDFYSTFILYGFSIQHQGPGRCLSFMSSLLLPCPFERSCAWFVRCNAIKRIVATRLRHFEGCHLGMPITSAEMQLLIGGRTVSLILVASAIIAIIRVLHVNTKPLITCFVFNSFKCLL
jgi:hypothetical protein